VCLLRGAPRLATERAGQHFRLATGERAGQEWPYERARFRLHHREWLRRAAARVTPPGGSRDSALGGSPPGPTMQE
jgi:hypothetical protein